MPVQEALKRLLETTSELPAAFTDHVVSLEGKTGNKFVHWAVEVEDIVTTLCEGTDYGTRPNKAKNRSAVGKARAMVATLDERAATGLNDEHADEPLRHEPAGIRGPL